MDSRKNKNVILLPIFPEYATAIMNGKKKVEFRKINIPNSIKHVVVYSTSPENKVVGTFEVENITKAPPRSLWRRYKDIGCVTKNFLFEYYNKHELGLAIHVGKVKEVSKPLTLSKLKKGLAPPQSFRYLEFDEWEKVKSCCTK